MLEATTEHSDFMPPAVAGVTVVIDVCVEVAVSVAVTVRVICCDDIAMNANNASNTTIMVDKAIVAVPIALL